ncbi:MAG: 2-dehydropantoate 2-reductase, partial [Chromatiales bacterium]|nr:2-dehydropantoate 2-reductase [Chromatiales bacterium]
MYSHARKWAMWGCTVEGQRIAIIGAGAVGCTVASALGDGGYEPLLVVRKPFGQVTRSLNDEQRIYEFAQLTEPGDVGPVDWVLLCTKAYQTEAVAHWLECLVGEHTTLAVLQNGVDQVERLSTLVNAGQVVPVVVQMACERTAPGQVSMTRTGRVYVPDTSRGRAFCTLFEVTTAFDALTEENFLSALWRKLAINAATGGIGALTLRPNEVLGAAGVRPVAEALMGEVVRVGRAEGAEIPDDFVTQTVDMLAGPVGKH